MWALIHLPSAEFIYMNEIKDFVDVVLEMHYWYLNPVTKEISRRTEPMSGLAAAKVGPGYGEIIRYIELNKCEFEVAEVNCQSNFSIYQKQGT